MITRIQKDTSEIYTTKFRKLVYLLYDEDTVAEFGFVGLTSDGFIRFKLIEGKYLSMEEVEIIYDFMKQLIAVESNKQLDTLREVYYFGNQPRPTQSNNTTGK